MSEMITEPDTYFDQGCGRCDRFGTPDCSTRRWLPGLFSLRSIALAAGLTETAKWGHPCYLHAGRNVAILGAFRTDFRLTFFDAALLQDPNRLLERQGANTRHADCLRFTDNAAPTGLQPVIRAYLAEAMAYAEQGIRPPVEPTEMDLPAPLIAALDSDAELAQAFQALTPGRQRSYVLLLSGAKSLATQTARLAKSRPRILAGKGANER